MPQMTRDALLDAARRYQHPGVSADQAIVLAFAELAGAPLDPWSLDDAAVVCRAETLILDGLGVADAVATAREELATWSQPT